MGVLPGAGVGSDGSLPCANNPPIGSETELVLLVEDDDTIAGLVTHILTRNPRRRVVRAKSGAECILHFAEYEAMVGLVILDCRLPDIDGPTLCHTLRSRRPNLPILLTSGRDLAAEMRGGATEFLAKPFRPADVERKVSSMLGAPQ